MKYIAERDAYALGLIALGTRLFYAVAIDAPGLLNAGWISALAACILTLPLGFCLRYLHKVWGVAPAEKFNNLAGRAFALVLCLFSLYDAGCSLILFASSAQYTALEGMSTVWLLFTPVVACGLCCMLGAQAVSGSARVYLRVLMLLLVIIFIVQLKSYNFRWLTPILGPGALPLMRPVPVFMGVMTGVAQLWLLKGPPENLPKRYSTPALIIVIALVVTAILVMYSMLLPSLTGTPDTRSFQLDRVLTNGRVSISLQLALVLVWYLSLTMMYAFPLLTASIALQIAIPALNQKVTAALCAVLTLLIPILQLSYRALIEIVMLLRVPIVTLPLFGCALFQAIKRKKEATAP